MSSARPLRASPALFSVDQYGNVSYSGSLQSVARVVGGATVTAFNATTTAPTVEDTGSAQLVAGSAVVRFDPIFAASIDPALTYRVFVTPDGDMPHGLFVALKSRNGFIVREMQAGRSSVAFDYRVVATALGKAGQRMAFAKVQPGIPAPPLPPFGNVSRVFRTAPPIPAQPLVPQARSHEHQPTQ